MTRQLHNIQHYQALLILGIKSGASKKRLKSAYRKLAMKHHPDKGGSSEDFIILKEAYDLLVSQGTKTPSQFTQPGFGIMGINDPFAGVSVRVFYRRAAM